MRARTTAGIAAAALAGGLTFAVTPTASAIPVGDRSMSLGQVCQQARSATALVDGERLAPPSLTESKPGLRCGQVFADYKVNTSDDTDEVEEIEPTEVEGDDPDYVEPAEAEPTETEPAEVDDADEVEEQESDEVEPEEVEEPESNEVEEAESDDETEIDEDEQQDSYESHGNESHDSATDDGDDD